jgi:hypothetical protein
LFLDDDVLLPEDFLLRYVDAIRSLKDYQFFAGAVIPSFDEPVRPWVDVVLRTHSWCFSALDLGEPTRALSKGQFPFGANMAIRSDLARRFQFEPSLGFKHGSLVPGEETALFTSLVEAGARGAWLSNVPLRHRLPVERTTLKFLMRRAYGQGRSDAVGAISLGMSSKWVLADLGACTIKILVAIVLSPSTAGALVVSWFRNLGHLVGVIRI